VTADPRTIWAEQLSVPPDAAPDAVIAAFLRSLPCNDFLPPAEKAAGVNALAATSLPVGKDYGVERLLREETEAFAARYWQLEPAERLTAWSDLVRRRAPAARLRELEPGLDVVAKALADPDAEELAALMRALFTMPPRDRALRRNTWLAERTADVDRWQAAFAAIQRDAPALAALDTQLRAALDPNFAPTVVVAGPALVPVKTERATSRRITDSITVSGFVDRVRNVRGQYGAPDPPANRGARGSLWALALACGLLLGFCGLTQVVNSVLRSGESASKRNPAAPGASSTSGSPALRSASPLQTAPPTPVPVAIHEFTVGEVAEFERYEREKNFSRVPPPQPNRYPDWCLAGRPPGAKLEGQFRPTITLDGRLLRELQEYDRALSGPRPVLYDLWVRLGKPVIPGTYLLPELKPDPVR
jgi:hypothetical protein